MNNPLISIIIPTYNRAHLISETLDSVITQTYTNWECIIVDDGSTDDIETVVREYLKKDIRFQFHHTPSDRLKGGNTARNYGFEVSNGEFIQWFDDDDIMMVNFLGEKIKAFSPELDLVISSEYLTNEFLENRKSIILNEQADLFKEYCLWKLRIVTGSVLFRKSFFSGKKLFLDRISRGQEAELFSRLFFKLSKERFKIINIPLFLYRQHKNSKTYHNNEYVREYKESSSFIYIENLKRSVELKDKELINTYYLLLIEFFFQGLDYKHRSNSNYILNNLNSILKFNKKVALIEIIILGKIFVFFSRGSYRVKKRWKSINL